MLQKLPRRRFCTQVYGGQHCTRITKHTVRCVMHVKRVEDHCEEMIYHYILIYVCRKWEIKFIGPIEPLGKKIGAHYIITLMEYLTRWVEAHPLKDYTGATTDKFLFKHVLIRFE